MFCSTRILIFILAKDNDFDVVLIDTAGRMQDNEVSDGCVCRDQGTDTTFSKQPLMRALAKVSI